MGSYEERAARPKQLIYRSAGPAAVLVIIVSLVPYPRFFVLVLFLQRALMPLMSRVVSVNAVD